jgi:hypothetical protein
MRFAIGAAAQIGYLLFAASACHGDFPLDDPGDAGQEGAISIVIPDGAPSCTLGGQCIQRCGAGQTTSISGTVYDPAGNNPLYNIAVYVPATLPLPALPGPPTAPVSCPHCADYYPPGVVAGGLTDTKGQFQLTNVPVGTNVPLVVQIGKWRTLSHVSITNACQDNPVADKTLLLPSSQAGPSDTLPEIAISTGAADSLECLLRRVGVAPAEFTNGAGGNGRIHIFRGGGGSHPAGPAMPGGSPPSPTALWPSGAELRKYDIVILSCEGSETDGMNPTALGDYANGGGRVFASHFHYAWFTAPGGPFYNDNLASWRPNSNDLGDILSVIQTAFYGGKQMHDWLAHLGALSNDELPIVQARYNASVSSSNTASVSWIVADPNTAIPRMDAGTAAGATEYFSFDTPTMAPIEQKCGRVVYSDLHVGAASNDYGVVAGGSTTGGIVPSGCANIPLSPQEKALEYMLFDLAACFTPPDRPPSTNNWPK